MLVEHTSPLEPTFFIITATHNRATRLQVTIESVLAQTYRHWRLFILDDGSEDNTPEVLAATRDHPRITARRFAQNSGANAARNAMLEEILALKKPGFIIILDDDDYFDPDALSNFAEAFRRYPQQHWFVAGCEMPDGTSLTQLRGREVLCYLRDHKCGSRMKGEVVHAFDVSLVRDARFPRRFRNAEEWSFFAELASRSRIQPLPFVATRMTLLPDGLSNSHPNRHRALEVYERKYEKFAPMIDPRQRARLLAKVAKHAIARGHFLRARSALREALRESRLELQLYFLVARVLMHNFQQAIVWSLRWLQSIWTNRGARDGGK